MRALLPFSLTVRSCRGDTFRRIGLMVNFNLDTFNDIKATKHVFPQTTHRQHYKLHVWHPPPVQHMGMGGPTMLQQQQQAGWEATEVKHTMVRGKAKYISHKISSTITIIKNLKTDSESPSSVKYVG